MARPPQRRDSAGRGRNNAKDHVTAYGDPELIRVDLDDIGQRPSGDTRTINATQVAELVESIAELGLIQPLAIDDGNRLLAGGHRLAALQQLRDQNLPRFNDLFADGIPCRRFFIDSETDIEQALLIEVSENEKRRNYTRDEIVSVAERLQAQGYSNERGRGNTKPLAPALQLALGVSRSTVQRALRQSNESRDTFDSPKARSLSLPPALVDRIRTMATDRGEAVADLLTQALDALAQEAD